MTLSLADVAAQLGLSVQWVHIMCCHGKLYCPACGEIWVLR